MNLLAQSVYYTTDSTNTTQATNGGMAIGLILFYLAIILILIVAYIKIFMKANRKWWEAIVPVYNSYVLLKIVGRPGWWLLLWFIPFVNIVISIIVMIDLAKAFGKGVGTGLGLMFLSPIFAPLMAFSDSYKYKGVGATAATQKPTTATQPTASANPNSSTGQAVTSIPAAGAAVGVGVGAAQDNEPITSAPLDQQPAGNPSAAIGSPPSPIEKESNPTPESSADSTIPEPSTDTPPPSSETDSASNVPETPPETPQPTMPTPPEDEPVPAPPPADDSQNSF